MRGSIRKGFSFGLISGVITTLGLIIGLHSSTHSNIVIIGGILIIAIADAMSDALGIHVSEEFESKHSTKEIWESTISTFLSKFIFASAFIIPFLFLQLSTAIVFSIIFGLSLITIFSYYMANQQNMKPLKVVLEHLIIAIIVITLSHFVGDLISNFI